jgi:cell cycle checkpoint protein
MDCGGGSEGGWYTFSPTLFVPILKPLWKQNAAAKRVGGWSRTDVILELGGILKAREAVGGHFPSSQAPAAHQLFSKMTFLRGGDNMRLSQLDEGDTGAAAHVIDKGEGYDDDDECSRMKEERNGGWLVEDDIQDFD